MSADVEEVKQRLNIVDVAGSYLELRKMGSGWKARCPFHNEKTPSFNVNQERQIYKCFGCNEAGDVIDFVMKMEHLTFPEALQLLADRAGVIIDKRKTPSEYAREKDEKSRLYLINRIAAAVFQKILLEAKAAEFARNYLKERGLNEAIIKQFGLGFAPTPQSEQSSILERFLTQKGFSKNEIRQAGSPDRFLNRIIFPLFDTLGNPVGFTGRTLDPNDQPKYLNTPETPLFKKGRLLYPLHFAKDAIKEKDRVILVEGQMDVLLAHQLGTKEAVATSGTALTTDHLAVLKRFTQRILFAFDADEAGLEATRKAILLAYDLELEPMVISLPEGYKDLGELALKNPELWAKAIEQAEPAFTWQLKTALKSVTDPTSATSKKMVARAVLPLLARIPDPIERAHWLQILARKLQVPERSIADALTRLTEKKPVGMSQNSVAPPVSSTSAHSPVERLRPEELLLGLLVRYPAHLTQLATRLDPNDFASVSEMAERLAKAIQICYTHAKTLESESFLGAVKANLPPETSKWLDSILFEIERSHALFEATAVREEIEAGFNRILKTEREHIKERTALLIAEAEQIGDRAQVQKLLKELQQMIK